MQRAGRLPRPPRTTAASRVRLSVSVKRARARRAVRRQRQHRAGRAGAAALTTNAETAGPAQVDAGQLGGDLVVADRAPAPADPAARRGWRAGRR